MGDQPFGNVEKAGATSVYRFKMDYFCTRTTTKCWFVQKQEPPQRVMNTFVVKNRAMVIIGIIEASAGIMSLIIQHLC